MSKLNVLVLGKMAESAREMLAGFADFEERMREDTVPDDELVALLVDKVAVISEPLDLISPELMDRCPSLAMIANRAVGFDNVDLEEASQRGVLVSNTPGVLDNATADLAFALLLSTARRLVEADRYVREGRWKGFKSDLMLGPDLYGKTVGIIGMGRIGTAFATRARAFGLRIIYCRSSSTDPDKDERLQKELDAHRVELPELLSRSDFISIHCPLNSHTEKLIGARELEQMKPDCILINTARGSIIDEAALVRHLQAGRLRGAGLDVFDSEPEVPEALMQMSNVVLTPHIGSACIDTRRLMAETAVQAISEAFSGKRPTNLVNAAAWDGFASQLPASLQAGSNG